jgi:hypothetical protein
MVGVEHLLGTYLTNPPAAGRLGLAIAILAILAAVTAYEWVREASAHR